MNNLSISDIQELDEALSNRQKGAIAGLMMGASAAGGVKANANPIRDYMQRKEGQRIEMQEKANKESRLYQRYKNQYKNTNDAIDGLYAIKNRIKKLPFSEKFVKEINEYNNMLEDQAYTWHVLFNINAERANKVLKAYNDKYKNNKIVIASKNGEFNSDFYGLDEWLKRNKGISTYEDASTQNLISQYKKYMMIAAGMIKSNSKIFKDEYNKGTFKNFNSAMDDYEENELITRSIKESYDDYDTIDEEKNLSLEKMNKAIEKVEKDVKEQKDNPNGLRNKYTENELDRLVEKLEELKKILGKKPKSKDDVGDLSQEACDKFKEIKQIAKHADVADALSYFFLPLGSQIFFIPVLNRFYARKIRQFLGEEKSYFYY